MGKRCAKLCGWPLSVVKIVGVLCLMVLSGCVNRSEPLPDPDLMPVRADWVEQSRYAIPEQAVLTRWWTQFNDPLLNQWIALALTENQEIEMAWARLREAQALMRATRKVRWPSLDLFASAERSRRAQNDNNSNRQSTETDYDLGLQADWDLDFFGQQSAQISGAQAQTQVREAQVQATVLATISAVVRQYYQYRGLQKRFRTTTQNTQLLQESLMLLETRQKVGEASEFDVSRARGEYQLSRARLPQLEGALRSTEHALSVVLGQPAGALRNALQKPQPLPNVRPGVPLGARATVLARRPDFLIAQAELAVVLADHGVAVADLYPKISIGGLLGLSHSSLGALFSSENQRWSAGIFLDWSLFQMRTRQHLVDAARENVMMALHRYERVALVGVAEVESAITLYDVAVHTQKRLADVVVSRQKSHRLARDLYEAGEEDYFAVIDAERELVARRDDLIVAETDSLLALSALYVALGGGWQGVDVPE